MRARDARCRLALGSAAFGSALAAAAAVFAMIGLSFSSDALASYETGPPEEQVLGDAPIEPPVGAYKYPDDFPLPPNLQANVEFWKKVYGEFTKSQVVFHDNENLSILYGFMDFSELEQRNISEAEKQRIRGLECDRTERWIQGILRDLSSEGTNPASLSADHRRIAALFGPNARPADFYQASSEDRIRWQTGLKDRFLEGLSLAGRYLPLIEKVFREEGLPIELSRLPFVESLFVNRARSHAGAVGIWQFMRSTGRLYLQVNAAVDERLDPILAARGAARLLADNYRVLGSWPLALTAYNHGRAGMARAVDLLGTRDLGTIVEEYRSPLFGFASRNFYSEFLAALTVYENRAEVFGRVRPEDPISFDEVSLDAYVSVGTAARYSGLSVESLKELNPALSDVVWRGRVDMPAGYRLRIPPGTKSAFLAGWGRIPAGEKRSTQKGSAYDYHRVKKGETLEAVAKTYGLGEVELGRLNGLKSTSRLRVGSQLRLPAGEKQAAAVSSPGKPEAGIARATAPGSRTTAEKPQAETYIVRAGDTPGEIARSHGMTVADLLSLNGIQNPKVLKPGRGLKVRTEAPPSTRTRGSRADESARVAAREAPAARQYVVREGDSLSEIARAHRTSVRAIQAENRLGRSLLIRPGQTLRIPE